MKHLNEALLESIFDIKDKADQAIIVLIHKFIKNNYDVKSYTISKEPVDGKYVVDVRGNVDVKNTHITALTNGSFRWGEVDGYFDCGFCKSLTSLEGAPVEVGGNFYCSGCSSLKTLEGAPEKVGSGFICNDCSSLKTLEGAPEKVGGGFSCNDCKSLKTLKGAPKEVGGNFCCIGCTSVKDKTTDSKVLGEIFCK